jgi:hypothetical protein
MDLMSINDLYGANAQNWLVLRGSLLFVSSLMLVFPGLQRQQVIFFLLSSRCIGVVKTS